MEYLLCSTPRVGSNLLCSLLEQTERAGRPAEYFWPNQEARYFEHLGDIPFHFESNMPTRYIHISRADVTGQALSYARALQTGAWLSAKAERNEPRFDSELIKSSVKAIVNGNEGWERLFEAYGIEPYRLTYERLMEDMPGELRGVLDYLEIAQTGLDLEHIAESSKGYFKKQRDATTEAWRRQWNEEIRRNAAAREQPSAALSGAA